MKINTEDIKQVLAMFDKEDIPYIDFEYLINNNIIERDNTKKSSNHHVKAKILGGNNDRTRKQ